MLININFSNILFPIYFTFLKMISQNRHGKFYSFTSHLSILH